MMVKNAFTIFVMQTDKRDPMKLFTNLSLRDKILLAHHLETDILPHISQFLSENDKNQQEGRNKESHIYREESNGSAERSEMNDDPDNTHWWEFQEHLNPPSLDEDVAQAPHPYHPLASVMVSLNLTRTMWDPHRPGFNLILLMYVRDSRKVRTLNNDSAIMRLFLKCDNCKEQITTEDLRQLCLCLGLSNGMGRKAASFYHLKLSQAYLFPSSSSSLKDFEWGGDEETQNKILNTVICKDLAIPIPCQISASYTRYFRTSENTHIDIKNPDGIYTCTSQDQLTLTTKESSNDLYKVVARCFNPIVPTEHFEITLHQKLATFGNLERIFLTENGTVNKDFEGCKTKTDLINRYNSTNTSCNNMWEQYPPKVVFALIFSCTPCQHCIL